MIVIVYIVVIILILKIRDKKVLTGKEEQKKAVIELLNAGYDISYKRYRLFYSYNSKQYILMHFDINANAKLDEEEMFEDINDAAAKIVQYGNKDKK